MSPGFAIAWQHKALALLVATQLAGCAGMLGAGLAEIAKAAVVSPELRAGSPEIPKYATSEANVRALRTARRSVELGEVSWAPSTDECELPRIPGTNPPDCSPSGKVVYCGLGPIKSEGERSFTQYFRSAFSDELAAAGHPASADRTRISMTLQKIEVYCHPWDYSWVFVVGVKIGEREPYTIKTVHKFDGSISGALTYQRARWAFMPAVQQTIAEIVQHPTFRAEYGLEM